MPGIKRRLEVHERDIERPLVDLVRGLERGDGEPVDGQQHDQCPAAQERECAKLGERVEVQRRPPPKRIPRGVPLPQPSGHVAPAARGRARLTYAVATRVTTISN